ncbi:MAG: NAD(P)-dependent oxidoreductase [Rhizobiaceae bacterium]|nr:NAD(P)-dependent oxidoreductase [Rhizobiaceae bacterium]
MNIAFIGFGEAGRAFQRSLAAHDPALAFFAYDRLLDTEGADGPCAAAMRAAGVAPAPSAEAAVADATWIISAVTADQSLVAAASVAPHVHQGQVFFDINSVSPKRKEASAALFGPGATYVDMAVMAPVHPKGHRTAVLLAGAVDDALAATLRRLDFGFDIVGDKPGAATAIKMVRSLFVKGLEAITVEALLAAEASGCLDTIMASLSGSYPGLGLPELAGYQFERTTRHGKRRAAEMRESAATLADLGLHAPLADAIADVQEKMGNLGAPSAGTVDLSDVVRDVLGRRRR